ncbi:VWA domain-containing protein [Paucibacter sp. O1-1]|nr:VWA domain-containing protein [Paucibacter sp. O1-1]MDA3831322.1 VWA domain-containing protein [Paucibacter sp. O1-1]
MGCLVLAGKNNLNPLIPLTQKPFYLIDQSISLYATDIKPNRLTRLKQKLQDIINTITEGEIAMVAFAGDALISPFSADKSTLTHFLLALDPLIMPLYGSNLLAGVQTSLSLLENNPSPAHLIIVTDSINSNEIIEIPKLTKLNSLQVSIIGAGKPTSEEKLYFLMDPI